MEQVSNIKQQSLLDIKKMYGSKIIRYRHQRPIVNQHILEIKNYIESSYNKKEFYLPPIVLVPNNNDQYEIIDGLHRCVAIAEKINENHPCMNITTLVLYKDILADSTAAMKLFMNINKARPMPCLYFEDDYIEKIYNNTVAKLKKMYGVDIINDTDKFIMTSKLNTNKLNSIINNQYIESLIINDKIIGLDNNEIFKLIRNSNNAAINYINVHMEINVFEQFNNLTNTQKRELSEFINKVLDTYNKEINLNSKSINLQANTILTNIKNIVDRWNIIKNSKNNNTINIIDYKPMVLGLFPKIPILELEQVFINTGLFNIE